MAKRTTTSRGKTARGPVAARQTKSKTPARAMAEVEVVEESGGMGLEGGVAIATTVLLLVAILFVDKHLGSYGSGMFF
jgi:non-canonical (house-cleaning) NTP pyrophosphatase